MLWSPSIVSTRTSLLILLCFMVNIYQTSRVAEDAKNQTGWPCATYSPMLWIYLRLVIRKRLVSLYGLVRQISELRKFIYHLLSNNWRSYIEIVTQLMSIIKVNRISQSSKNKKNHQILTSESPRGNNYFSLELSPRMENYFGVSDAWSSACTASLFEF